MKKVIVLIGVLICGCGDSKETKLQRFLLQSNDLVKNQKESQAEYYLKEALKLDSCFADAWNNLGTIYFNQQKFSLALEHYNRALDCRPGYLDAYFNRANTEYELKEYYSALEDIDRIVKE